MLTVCHRTRSFSPFCAMLYIFEDNEAVIKMIIKGRSPTMRHVSRTHRVALDWLFDRINLDPKIQIKNVNTKHQLADILTQGDFTRDEWNNLLCLYNISHFSSRCCAQNFSLTSCTRTMAKMMQEQKGDNRIVAKSKPTTMNLAVSVSTSSSTVNSPIASKIPGILKALCRTDWSSSGKPDARNSNHDAASSSQGWRKRCSIGRMHRETCRRRIPRISRNPRNSRRLKRLGGQRYGRSPTDQVKDLDVNTALW